VPELLVLRFTPNHKDEAQVFWGDIPD
jgi:hypothetical protein